MNATSRRRVISCLPAAYCVVALCIALHAGCSEFKPFDSQLDRSPGRQRDKEFAEGAGRAPTLKTQYAYARILSSQRQDAACDALLTKLISEHPRFLAAYLLQAEVRMRMRRIDDAILTLQSALRVAPRDDILRNNLGVCYLMKPDCSNALQCFVAAAALQPSNSRYRANMALALGLLGRGEESASLYTMVVSLEDAEQNVAVLNSARGAFLGTAAPQPRPTAQTSQPAAPMNNPNGAIEEGSASQ